MTAPVPPAWEGASAPRVSLVTMGCAKNEVDSAAMARALAEALGLTVAWDSANSTVVLTHPQAAAPQPESVPAPEPAPIEAPSAAPEGANTVYVTRTGQRYHYSSTCNGGTYYESTLEAARARGLTPCDKCVLTN